MKVICSGYPKTGTKTLSAALRILGYNVFDFEEQFFYRGRELMKVMDEGWTTEDIHKIFKDVDVVTDAPGCVLWEEILKAFPDAKIVHRERASEEEWAKSLAKQMDSIKTERLTRILVTFSPTGNKLRKFYNSTMRLFACAMEDHPIYFRDLNADTAKLRYREHNTRVREVAPKEQILYFKFSDGWETLCKFLDKPIPAKPFPHKNKGGEITAEIIDKSYVFNQIRKEISITSTFIAILLGLFVYCLW